MVKLVRAYEILVLICCLLLPVIADAQQKADTGRITISGNNIPLSHVFKTISKQTGLHFAYDNAAINDAEKVSLNFTDMPWEKVLTFVLRNRNVTWLLEGRRIFLQPLAAPEAGPPLKDTLSVTIRGRITASGGIPIPGVTIVVKGTSRGATTGTDGVFTLYHLASHAPLRISSLGYTPVDTVLSSVKFHEIELSDAVNSLDATVVIGYGSSSRRMLTGSVSTVSASQLAAQPVANPLAALQGQVPGIQVTNTSGLPGAQIKLFIRGRNSIAAGNDPLFIVDGVPFDITPLNNVESLLNAAGRISPFNSINPSDIESIDILKDADATAIYGSRGANGVVLITTKKGKPGHLKTDLNFNTGVGVTAGYTSMLNTSQYLSLRREAFKNDGVTPTAAEAPDLFVWDTTRSINWQRRLTGGTAPITNAQVTLSGGSSTTTFRVGGNYYSEGSVMPANLSYRRGGAHLSLQHYNPDHRLDASLTASFTADRNRSIANDLSSFANLPPNYPLYDQSGALFWGSSFDNPEAWLRQKTTSKTNNLLTNAVLRYRLLPGLQLKTSLGMSNISMHQLFIFPQSAQHPQNAPISFTREAENDRESYIIEPQADYKLNIAKGKLQLLVGGTWQQTVKTGRLAEGQGYQNESMLGNLSEADTIIRPPDTYTMYRYISFFTRLTYDWQSKYLLNISYRRDGSSRFGPGKQFGNFGAIGLGWIFSQENFMKDLTWVSYGKLRASGGLTGNDQIPDYQYMSNYGVNTNYQGSNTLRPLRIANNNYSWEENKKMEAALELGFLDNRIFFSAARYYNRSSNQLVGYQLPGITGFTSYQANLPAKVENTGWEFEVQAKNINTSRLTWNSSANISFFNNRLLEFQDLASSSYANQYIIGQSLNIVRGYRFKGVDPQTGVATFKDYNGDGSLTAGADYTTISNTDPVFYGGFRNDIQYGAFRLEVFCQFVKQQGKIIVNKPGDLRNQTIAALDRWQHPGDVTMVPRATATPGIPAYDNNEILGLSSASYVDASYLRLKNVQLSYIMPEALSKRLKLKLCRLYIQGQNLLTFSGYQGADPETQVGTAPLRIVTTGIQLTL
ncbi:SusC/RagA family TonB-linked outer membrane protein [Chitinophaga tropicalis]|uniref:SusC/RagA family TonB-linked outer membrane protein n=1 Tax=Chitinophaga tropicalis TaxID=2683588 RepID=A0A7K1U3R8_9BACT|nr:SusC/RagA family TonB-linked outer membrane protein [Chitinophaga tropicalis]MVT08989.1 SusC/RagA family TonB-linked outer membrane protein [Chitinophaga tropicalis]